MAANASERAVRGLSRTRKKDEIYRAASRGESTHVRKRQMQLAKEIATGHIQPEPGAAAVQGTWAEVTEGWRSVARKLREAGDHERADGIRAFLSAMPPAMTEKDRLQGVSRETARSQREFDQERTR